MLQHNLGLAYFDRSKGERWENLQKSIECFNKSLKVFTQDNFLAKWQINQEDLSQSLKALKVEEQNLILPTFKSKLTSVRVKDIRFVLVPPPIKIGASFTKSAYAD